MACKSWVGTLNNYTERDIEIVTGWEPDVSRLKVSKEIGDEGTPHLQMACIFKSPKRMAALKKLLPRAHWEPMIDKSGAFMYIDKEGSDLILNILPQQGRRNDLASAYDAVEAKLTRAEFLRTRPGLQAIRVFDIARGEYEVPDWRTIEVRWLYGSTGTGKSRTAREAGAFFMKKEGRFWSDYWGQAVVCFDDIRPEDFNAGELLRLLDGGSEKLNIKYGGAYSAWTTVYITTPLSPDKFWHLIPLKRPEDRFDQLARRITHTTHMGTATEPEKALEDYLFDTEEGLG